MYRGFSQKAVWCWFPYNSCVSLWS